MLDSSSTPKPFSRSKPRWPWFRSAVVLASAALVLVWLLPLDRWPSLCATRQITGTPCPTCGMGRSLHALLHGDLVESLRFHPLVPLFAAAATLWAGLHAVLRARTGRGIPAAAGWAGFAVGVGLILAVWALRLAAGTIP